MLHFEVESDRDVTLDAIGLLKAGVPVVVTDDMLNLFKVMHGVSLPKANFAPYIKVTAVVSNDSETEN